MTGGVIINNGGGATTLSVGTVGGPQTDIFTNNSAAGLVVNPTLVAASTNASSFANITFNSSSTVFGAIGVTQPGGPFFLNLSGGNAGTTVTFDGPVFATTTSVSGTGTLNFNSGSSNTTATNFAADGTISLAPNTTVVGALTTTAGANTGTLSLGSASTLNGAVGGAVGLKAINVVGGSNITGVTANITGAVNAFTFGLGTNTLTIGGALTIANGGAGGVINTTLASPTLFGNIRPVGATNLGAALTLNVTVPSTAFIPVGTQFNIVQTQSGTLQSGTNGSIASVTVQDPTNPLYTFSQVPASGTVAGLVTITTTGIPLTVPIAPPPGIPLPPTVPIAAPVVPVLLTIPLTPDLGTFVLPAINALSDATTVVNAIAQLSPSTADLAAPLATFQGTRQFQKLWSSRLDDVFCSQVNQPYDRVGQPDQQPSNCQGYGQRSGWWLKGFGYSGAQGARGPFVGYDTAVFGTMIGFDTPLAPDARGGVSVGYAGSTIDGKKLGGGTAGTDFNAFKAAAYVGYEPGPWFVRGDASLGLNDYSGTRNIVFPGLARTAKAGYSGQDYTVFGSTGYHFFTEGYTITPLASLQYTHLDLDGYTESGAGDLNLKVNSQNYDFLESGLGVKVARPFAYNDGPYPGTYVPEIHFNWFRELNNPTLQNRAAFAVAGSRSFTTPGLKPADDTLNVGIGLTFLSCSCTAKTWSVEAVYDYYWRSDNYSAHAGLIKFTARF